MCRSLKSGSQIGSRSDRGLRPRLTEWGLGTVRGQVRHSAANRDQHQVAVFSCQQGHHHREVREHEPVVPLMEPGICMGDGSSTEDAKPAGISPLRLRVGVFLILLWIVARSVVKAGRRRL
jgi:hypothetical protein